MYIQEFVINLKQICALVIVYIDIKNMYTIALLLTFPSFIFNTDTIKSMSVASYEIVFSTLGDC
jgi:hypothetical protein